MKITESKLNEMIAESVKKTLMKENKIMNFFRNFFMKDNSHNHDRDYDLAMIAYQVYYDIHEGTGSINNIDNVINNYNLASPKERAFVKNAVTLCLNKTQILNEGTTDSNIINAWYKIEETVGADTMLDCIFQWSSTDQLAKYIEWFKQEEYFTPEENEM